MRPASDAVTPPVIAPADTIGDPPDAAPAVSRRAGFCGTLGGVARPPRRDRPHRRPARAAATGRDPLPAAAATASTRRAHLRLVLFLAGVFVLKLIVVLQLKDHPLVQPDVGLDTSAYVDLARRVLDGDVGLGPGLYYVSPLYIYVLAAGLAVTDSFTAVRVLQITLGTAAVGLVLLTAREWFGNRAGWIAGSLAALTGLFTFYEALLMQAALDPFLTAAALFALTMALRRDTRAWVLASGAVFGLAALNRPNMMLAAAGLAVVLLVARRIRPATLLAAGLALGMAPAAIRNVVVSGQWTFISSHGGLNFYIGNNANATGFYQAVPGITPTIEGQERDARRVAGAALGRQVTDAEASDYFFGLATSWVREHPGRAAVLLLRKLGYVFHAQHIALPYSFSFYAHDARTMLRFYGVGPWLLIPLGAIGLVWAAPAERRRDYVIWASFVPIYATAVALFFVAERYRLPLLIPLCAGAAAAIDRALVLGHARRLMPMAVPGAALLVVAVAANWRLPLSDGRWDEGLRMAQRLVIIDRLEDAVQWAERLESTATRPGAARAGVGLQLLARGKPADALPLLRRAHQDDPGNATAEYALGRALASTGQREQALPHLRRGLAGGPDVPMAGFDLAAALKDTGDRDGALAALARVRPDDDDLQGWLRCGRLAMELQAPSAAEPFFRRAVDLAPAEPGARVQYGLNLLVLGRHAEGATQLTEAVRLDPRDVDALAHLAVAEFRLGRLADANQHVRAALAIDPGHPVARQVAAALGRSGA